jgi:hypothetical protein
MRGVVVAAILVVFAATTTASGVEPTKKKKGAKPDASATTAAPAATATVTTAPAPAQVAVVAPSPAVEAIPATAVAPGEEADRPGFSIAGLVGFDAGSGYSGFAVGARGGYTFPFHLYLGGDLSFYIFGGGAIISVAPEVGYDFALPVGVPILVRPYVGVGLVDVTAGGLGAAFEIYPGAELVYDITRNLFVGGDLRVPILFVNGQAIGSGGTAAVFNLFATIGYKF